MFNDCVCFLLESDEFINTRDFQFGSGFLVGHVPLHVPILSNIFTASSIMSLLDENRTKRRIETPGYIPKDLLLASMLLISNQPTQTLLNILQELSKEPVYIYLLIKLSPSHKKKWREYEEKRNTSIKFNISLPSHKAIYNDKLEGCDDDFVYLLLQKERSGYTRVDSKYSTDLFQNALEAGSLGTSSMESFFSNDLSFKTGINPKFGS